MIYALTHLVFQMQPLLVYPEIVGKTGSLKLFSILHPESLRKSTAFFSIKQIMCRLSYIFVGQISCAAFCAVGVVVRRREMTW